MNLEVVNQINASPYKAFVAIVGGGQSFIGDYLKISGASKTIVGAIVPYDRHVFDKFVGQKMTEYSSVLAARKLALASFQQCLDAEVEKAHAIGIGGASSIASDGERVGRIHKINIAVHTIFYTKTYQITLTQGRTRDQEDTYIAEFILTCLANATGNNTVELPSIAPVTNPEFDKIVETIHNNEAASYVLLGTKPAMFLNATPEKKSIAIFSGSFNPIHDGHLQIKQLAEKILGEKVYFELAIKNADKGMLDFEDIGFRTSQFKDIPYILTVAATTKEKIDTIKALYPDIAINIVMGVDTWERIWNPKYGYEPKWLEKYFEDNKVRFLVFGRNHIPIDRTYGANLLIASVEAEGLQNTYSSSAIRAAQSK